MTDTFYFWIAGVVLFSLLAGAFPPATKDGDSLGFYYTVAAVCIIAWPFSLAWVFIYAFFKGLFWAGSKIRSLTN